MKQIHIAAGFAVAALAFAAGIAPAQDGRSRPPKKAPPAPMPVPFAPGEQLSYRISWGPAEAATAQLAILPPAVIQGVSMWRFQAKASTIKATRFLYALDDRFDSYSDVYTLSSAQYEMTIREPDKHQDRVIRMNHEGQPAPAGGDSVRVPVDTRDPVGLVYVLRVWDWSKSKEAAFPVYDGRKLYEVRAAAGPAGPVSVPAGNFTARPIALKTFEQKKELTNIRFRIWLASDAARTPVLMEAELPFGKLRVELVDTRRN